LQAVEASARRLPDHDIVDIVAQTDLLHEVLRQLIDGWVLDKALAEVEGGADDARLFNQNVHGHLEGRINHFWLHNCVLNQIFAIHD